MYENITYEVLLDRMLSRVKSITNVDTSEGSLIYTALAVEAYDLAQIYAAIDEVYEYTFADTAPREELIRRASERGIEPKEATYAVLKGVFNLEIELDQRFTQNDLTYVVTEHIDGYNYKLQCETSGTIGNRYLGELIPLEFIDGLERAELVELLIPATDEEDTEVFRERYFASFNSQAFGGNRYDYIEKIGNIQGVGGVKIRRASKEIASIAVQIINSEYKVPSPELVKQVQNAIDPVTGQGEGIGFAPIGHIVNVSGVEGVTVNISTTLTYDSDFSYEDLKDKIESTVDAYILELCKSWADSDYITVRIAQIESKLLTISGIIDIEGTKINESANNLVLKSHQIPIRGVVNAN